VLRKSLISSAVIMFIIANAGLFAYLITRAGSARCHRRPG
jgi:C4-dicarboxylate transporter DctM subunit